MSVMDQHVHENGSDDCESNGGGGFTPIPDALRLPIHLLSDTLEDRNLAVASEVARSRGSLLDPSPEAAGGLRYSGMLRAARMYIASASMLSGLYFGFGFELLPPLVSGFTSLYTLVRSMSGYRTPILRGGLSIDGMVSRGIVVVRAACIPWSLVYVALTERTVARVALVLTIVVECMTVIRNILKMKGFLGVDLRDSLRGKAEALEQVRREGASLPDLRALRERAQGVIPGCDDWAEERLHHCFGLYPKPLAIEGTGGSISYEGHTYEVISDGSTLLEWRQKRVYGTKPGIMISNCGATATTAWGGPVRVIPACAFSGDRRFGSTWLEMGRALSSFVNTVLVVWLAFSSNTTHAVRLRPAAVGEFCAIALGVFGASDVDSSVTYRLLDLGSSFTIGRGRHAAYRVASWAVMLGSLVGAGLVFESEGATLGAAMTFVTPLAVALGAAFMGGANQYVALLGWYFGSVAYECSALVLILGDSPVAGLIALVGGVLADADLLRHFVLLTVIVEGLSGGNILLPKVSAGFAWRLGQNTSMLAVVVNRALSLPEVVDLGDVTTDLVPGKLTGDLEKMHTTERTSGKLSLFRRTGDAMYQERNCTVQSSGMGMCSPACVGGHIVPVLAAPHLRGVEVYTG